MTEKISVIIPVFNRADKIKRCLNSVFAQEYKNIEIIVIDDKSTDNSVEVINSVKGDRIKLIALNKNGGVSNARNVGIENATGDYIAFIDSDDYIEPDMFKIMLTLAVKYDLDVVLSDLDMREGDKSVGLKISLTPNKVYSTEEIKRDILPKFSYPGKDNLGLYSFSTKLYKREILIKNNIRFDKNISYSEDKLFVIEVFANCKSLLYTDNSFYRYETSPSGLYSAFNVNSWKWYVALYEKFYRLIDKYGIENIDDAHLGEEVFYNVTRFLYRTKRIENKKEKKKLQKEVVFDNGVKHALKKAYGHLGRFDKFVAKAIINGNRFFAVLLIDFIYSGKKNKLLKFFGKKV